MPEEKVPADPLIMIHLRLVSFFKLSPIVDNVTNISSVSAFFFWGRFNVIVAILFFISNFISSDIILGISINNEFG